MSESSRPKTPFISGGHMLETPPLSARIIRWIDRIYLFFGLYFVTLFSLNSYAAADKSSFNIASSRNQAWTRPRWGGSSDRGNNNSGGSGGSGGGKPDDGSGFGGRRVGRVSDFKNTPVYKGRCCQ
ncbi:hypothetical protein TMatcc_009688 [Talaromyces marneffei ATCC 18224]|uniref:uncharacterized protein n=1 Tax=Talaromyces marneffei TaxID=37727 RepID=UPI0012A83178|nr:uncharacterized protein EYB26_008929 [Talaromyces marneffei]KAE8547867.1 hypothetical protein EYB25_009660 [Talaromyces marneffei]QGA21219.1 hypothetical protein EYB26_008929 [Talaromyces marneffei]